MMKLRDLQLPKGLNLDLLLNVLLEDELLVLIEDFADKPRSERKVILPSRSCIRKCLVFYLVEKHKGDFSKVMQVLKDNGSPLASHGHYITNVKRLYRTRCAEIKRELANER